jgi:hypothetical protein
MEKPKIRLCCFTCRFPGKSKAPEGLTDGGKAIMMAIWKRRSLEQAYRQVG